MNKVMKKYEGGEGEQSKKLGAWTNPKNHDRHGLSHGAGDHIKDLLDKYWKAHIDAQESGRGLKFDQVQQKLFESLERTDADTYQMAEDFIKEATVLVRRRTELRRPVRREIDQIRKNRRCDNDNVLRHSKTQRDLLNETRRLERRIKKKSPELIMVEDSIHRLRFLAKHLTSDYNYWKNDRAEQRRKEASRQSRKNPKIVARVKKAGEAYLQAKESFKKAYRELEGKNPSNGELPESRFGLTRLLERSEGV